MTHKLHKLFRQKSYNTGSSFLPGLHSASILSTLKKLLLAITSLSGLNLGWANNFPKAGPPF